MPQFSANLSMLYQELEFLDRFQAAARDGFKAVEFLFPYAFAADELALRLKTNNLRQVLFNAPPGDHNRGQSGLACIPEFEAEFRTSISQALRYAQTLQCPRIHVMAGLLPVGSEKAKHYVTYVNNLSWAAQEAARQDVEVLIEPINTRDMPCYFLNRQDQAHEIVAAVGAVNLKVQMDLYHCQVVEGDVAMKLRRYLPTGNVGHIQIAGVPERHEPDTGELNYRYLFQLLDELAYTGWVGCEYRPKAGAQPGGTSAGLTWLKPWL